MKHGVWVGIGAGICSAAFAGPALADQAAIAAGVAAGTTAAAAQPAARPPGHLPGWELDDWRDPRTGTTTHLFYQCGHTVEVRLSGTSAANFVTVTLLNEQHAKSTFSPDKVTASFDGGPTRRLIPISGGDVILQNQWWGIWAFRFPKKEDFEDRDRMTLAIPVMVGYSECEIEAGLERDPHVPLRAETYTDYTMMELYLEVGSRVLAFGGQQTLSGGDGLRFDVGFAGFFSVHHGIFGDIEIEGYGREGLDALDPGLTVQEGDRLGSAAFWGGYAFRAYITSWLDVNYGIGIGPYVISLSNDDDSRESTEVVYLGARQRLRFDVFGRIADGSWFGFGPALHHLVIFDGSFGSADASGHALGVTGALVVAY